MQSTVGEQLRIASPAAARPHPALITVDRLGVEEELEGFTSADIATAQRHLAPLWTSHQDGSLRNGGVEFVTAGGLGGQDLYAAFERLTHLLANVVEYQDTFRCSTHMHVDMLDFTVPQVANFLLVYTACEPYLFEHCGQYRRSSNFCVPVGDSLPFHKTLISTLYEDCVATRYSGRYTNKYTALNLQPLFGSDRVRPIGTVEFRGGRPMTTMDEFLLQANLLLSIKQFVRSGPSDPEELLRSMGDTVTNSVYANGAAQHLRPDVAELEEAMISSWMLLKAFQQGMKKKPVKGLGASHSFSMPEGMSWDTAGIPPSEALAFPEPVWKDRYWNDATMGIPIDIITQGADAVQEHPERANYNQWPTIWEAYNRFFDDLQGYSPDSRGFIARLNAIFKGRGLSNVAMGEQESTSLGILWRVAGIELSILPAIRRAMASRLNSGRRQCIVRSSYSMQPTVVLASGDLRGLDWRNGLTEGYLQRVGDLFGRRTYGRTRIPDTQAMFFEISEAMVRVKNREALQAAINAVCMTDDIVNVTDAMYCSDLYHICRMAGVSTATHIFRGDLPTYDRIAEAMQMLYACGLSVPVRCAPRNTFWGTQGPSTGKLRITTSHSDRLGLGWRTDDQTWSETRTPRTVIDSLVKIY